jgi:phosphatidylglycerophosphate synthase
MYMIPNGIDTKAPYSAKLKVVMQMFSYACAIAYLAWPSIYGALVLANICAAAATCFAIASASVYARRIFNSVRAA